MNAIKMLYAKASFAQFFSYEMKKEISRKNLSIFHKKLADQSTNNLKVFYFYRKSLFSSKEEIKEIFLN